MNIHSTNQNSGNNFPQFLDTAINNNEKAITSKLFTENPISAPSLQGKKISLIVLHTDSELTKKIGEDHIYKSKLGSENDRPSIFHEEVNQSAIDVEKSTSEDSFDQSMEDLLRDNFDNILDESIIQEPQGVVISLLTPIEVSKIIHEITEPTPLKNVNNENFSAKLTISNSDFSNLKKITESLMPHIGDKIAEFQEIFNAFENLATGSSNTSINLDINPDRIVSENRNGEHINYTLYLPNTPENKAKENFYREKGIEVHYVSQDTFDLLIKVLREYISYSQLNKKSKGEKEKTKHERMQNKQPLPIDTNPKTKNKREKIENKNENERDSDQTLDLTIEIAEEDVRINNEKKRKAWEHRIEKGLAQDMHDHDQNKAEHRENDKKVQLDNEKQQDLQENQLRQNLTENEK